MHGLEGKIRAGNEAITYYKDPHELVGKCDFVMANPPFNVDEVSLSGVEKDKRFNTYGIPRNKSKVKKADAGKETVPNANYLWINLFATSLKPKGRAALVILIDDRGLPDVRIPLEAEPELGVLKSAIPDLIALRLRLADAGAFARDVEGDCGRRAR